MKPGDMVINPHLPELGCGLLLNVVEHPDKKKSRWALIPATYTIFWSNGMLRNHVSSNITVRRVSMARSIGEVAPSVTQGSLLCSDK